ncbi:MAG: hypothetical protein V4610_15365 [Pseudomonadota bacterium]|uniref:Uncharacterized protein n=1 Tax=hydrothermal vent metagenome TaxID=652676 RepID=A0A160TJ25_9ZZZZ
MYRFALALAAIAMTASPVAAAPACKDAKGKFIKCPPAAATPVAKPSPAAKAAPTAKPKPAPAAKSTGKCRNAKGQFAKCGTPGARPA